MAKGPKSVTGLNTALLTVILQATDAGAQHFVTQDEAKPFIDNNPALVVVNSGMVDPTNANKRAARITDAGRAFLTNEATAPTQFAAASMASPFAIITNAVLPEDKKRGGFGGGGAPVIYPFDLLEIGGTFFVPATDKKPNPAKSLASTISAQKMKYAEQVGNKTVTRTKRGKKNRAELNADGSKVTETVTIPDYKYTRNFKVKAVEAGKNYGGWVAPSNGALVGRVALNAE